MCELKKCLFIKIQHTTTGGSDGTETDRADALFRANY